LLQPVIFNGHIQGPPRYARLEERDYRVEGNKESASFYPPIILLLLALIFFVSGAILISKGYDCDSENIGLTAIIGGMILAGTSGPLFIIWFTRYIPLIIWLTLAFAPFPLSPRRFSFPYALCSLTFHTQSRPLRSRAPFLRVGASPLVAPGWHVILRVSLPCWEESPSGQGCRSSLLHSVFFIRVT
jgi:hypothetical protein